MADQNTQATDEITVSRARYDQIQLYEISEDELNQIERGSPSSNYLNFSIALLSVFLSFLAVLLTTHIPNIRVYLIFVVICVATAISGGVLMIMWLRSNQSSKQVFAKIRARKKPDEIRAAIAADNQSEPTEADGE